MGFFWEGSGRCPRLRYQASGLWVREISGIGDSLGFRVFPSCQRSCVSSACKGWLGKRSRCLETAAAGDDVPAHDAVLAGVLVLRELLLMLIILHLSVFLGKHVT